MVYAPEKYMSQGHFGQNTFNKQLGSIMTHWISSMQIWLRIEVAFRE